MRDWVTPEELSIREFNALRGKLCSAIEAMGLPREQERATITLVKQISYHSQDVVAQLLSFAVPTLDVKYQNQKVEVKDDG